MIICIGSDGKVAEIGTYKELSANKEGAFSKLMEWQMEAGGQPRSRPHSAQVTEEEELAHRIEEGDKDGEDIIDEDGTKVRKEQVTKSEAVAEKVQGGQK